jgi:hypothetical protein
MELVEEVKELLGEAVKALKRGARRQLIAHYGYRDEELPTTETIATKLNELGYYPQTVAKSQPKKTAGNRCHLCLRGLLGRLYFPFERAKILHHFHQEIGFQRARIFNNGV